MSNVVCCNSFALLRAASEQARLAEGIRAMSAALTDLEASISVSCQDAKRVVERVQTRNARMQAGHRKMHELVQEHLEENDLEAMEALRDQLLVDLEQRCNKCGSRNPFDVEPSGPSGCWCSDT